MNSLRDRLIRLGAKRPDLRQHIRPVLDELGTRRASRHKTASAVKRDVQKAFMQLNKKYGDAIRKQVEALEFEDMGVLHTHDVLSSAFSLGWDEPTVEYLLEVVPEGRMSTGVADREIVKIVQKVLGVSSSALNVQDGAANSRYGLTVRATIYPDLGTIT